MKSQEKYLKDYKHAMQYKILEDILEEMIRELEYMWQLNKLEEFIKETIEKTVIEMNVRGENMKCQEEILKMCMNAIKYKKYAEIRQCEKCCLYCQNRCDEVCEKAREVEGSCTNTQ